MFVPGKPSQSTVMFAGKSGVYPIVAPNGELLAVPINIRLGWIGMPWKNYNCTKLQNIVPCTIKLLTFVINNQTMGLYYSPK